MVLSLVQKDFVPYGTEDTEVDNSLLSETDYFELVRLHNGNIQNKLVRTGYSGIDDYLAQRTYDESGNYIVSGFNLEMREHLRDAGNTGYKDGTFTSANGGETGKFALKLGQGKAYVEGYEYNTFGETIVSSDKTRDSDHTKTVSGENVVSNLGLHVKVTNSAGGITLGTTTTDFDNMGQVYFVGPTGLALDGTTAGAVGNSGGVIGKGRIQTLISNGTDYASVFLADIEMGVCGGVRYPFYLTNSIHGASANTRIDGFVHDTVAGDKYMTISPSHGKHSGVNSYKTVASEPRFTGNVFKVENAGVKRITGLDYTARVTINATSNGTGLVTIDTQDINNNIVPTAGRVRFPSFDGSTAVPVTSVQVYGINGAVGQFLTPTSSSSPGTNEVHFYDNNGTGDYSRTQLAFKVGGGVGGWTDKPVKVFANVVVDDSGDGTSNIHRTKTKTEGVVVGVTMASVNSFGQVEGKLPYSDVYNINSITFGSEDISQKFFIDLGNKPSFYDHATIVAMDGSGMTEGSVVQVNFDYWTHGPANEGGGYFAPFTAESYVDAYESIGAITTRELGTVSLRDCLDFRPARVNVAGSEDFNTVFVPYHSSTDDLNPISVNYSHYMGRIDFLYLRNDKVLKLVKGTPSVLRTAPPDILDGMLLATIKIPPYVYNINDIRINIEDNNRYTMRDIGHIKDKVDRLEYYTALSLLEASAENTMMVDANGLPRFKNGILVDPFADHNIGDQSNPDYNILIDDMQNVAHCPQATTNLDLEQHDEPESLELTVDDCYVLKSTRISLIEQTVRSNKISVNPYNVVAFTGDIKCRPSTDTWTDTTTMPAQALSTTIDARVEGLSALTDQAGTVLAGTNVMASGVIAGAGAAAANAMANTQGRNWWGNWAWAANTGRQARLASLQASGAEVRTNQVSVGRRRDTFAQIRTERFQASESTTSSTVNLGNRVVETQNIPFMRAKNIRIAATGLRPNTRVYPFFDGQDVTSRCTPGTFANNRVGNVTTGNMGEPLTTDNNGKIGLHFDLVNGIFRTGTRMFKLSDHVDNSAQLETTFGDTDYTATGLLQVVQATTMTTSVRRSQISRFIFCTDRR